MAQGYPIIRPLTGPPVSRLQATLTTINNLSRDATNSPIRLPLDELLTQARTLRLIDNSVVQELLRHETLLRQRFLAQVDDSGCTSPR